ncbi:MAG: S8 family serine peptidase [Bacteroidetes bacterium]|nr:S8 family serine peptidase [Bacteroidota bacterium]
MRYLQLYTTKQVIGEENARIFLWRLLTGLIVLFLAIPVVSAQDFAKYRFDLADKNNNPYSIEKPEEFLSQRAIQRRIRQNIAVIESDLPVNPHYIDSLRSLGLRIINRSKWFNSVIIETGDSILLDSICKITFIDSVTLVKPSAQKKSLRNKFIPESCADLVMQTTQNDQLTMLNGHILHEYGFRGEGMQIAVIDAGFTGADILPAFDSMWINGQILGQRDFVDGDNRVLDAHSHGMTILSILGGNLPGELTGSAPKAGYWLLRSEDTGSEYRIEEENWISAAEFADSAGVDVINTSLGYSTFDDTLQNYTYKDMDGRTTRISKGVVMAASKGILVVVSAGNEGNKLWKYITAPADADSILAIGAVDSMGQHAPFSSVGPSYDRRVKPDIAALGVGTVAQGLGTGLIGCNGTSCSAPVISGLAACLWQANRQLTNLEIIEMIKQSGSQYQTPDTLTGYGLPNFANALSQIGANLPYSSILIKGIYPNPFINKITLLFVQLATDDIIIELYNIQGKMIIQKRYSDLPGGEFELTVENLNNLSQGIYIIKILSGEFCFVKKLVK